jgi:DNA topoisomerase-3
MKLKKTLKQRNFSDTRIRKIMEKTLIIAEKPSLANEIRLMLATFFGVRWQRMDGFYESDQYLLCWFFGHLLTALKPDEYDEKLKVWRMNDLPILPQQLHYRYQENTKKQGKLLVQLARKASSIVNATDPDREGQSIFRIWYGVEKITLPVKRLWATSLASKDLKKSWERMKSDTEYNNLAHAAQLRSYSDWLVGMNASRAYSIKFNKKIPIGRVLTATLALIVKRDQEVENFKESFYYMIKGEWCGIRFTYINDEGITRLEDKAQVEKLFAVIKTVFFSLLEFKKERKIENPPKPFSMPDLQKTANVIYGFDLDKTLRIAQSLYEKKIISYPRTDSPYLAPADRDSYYETIRLFATPQQQQLVLPKGEKVACLRDSDAAHTAIIPTGITPSGITGDERLLFDLICNRFITAFLRPRIYHQTTIFISDGVNRMRAIIVNDIDTGWRSVAGNHETAQRSAGEYNEDEEIQSVSVDEKSLTNRNDKLLKPVIETGKKAKPKYFTPATLLTAMINAGKSLEDKELKDIMREVEGLGTAATRDQFPLHLKKYGYIEQKGKFLISTSFGRWLIPHVQDELCSAAYTASLEKKLKQIEYGAYSPQNYHREIQTYTTSIVTFVVNAPADTAPFSGPHENSGEKRIACPKCGKVLRKFPKGYSCFSNAGGCGFVVWNTLCGKKLTDKMLLTLITKRKTAKIKGFYSKAKDKKFDARLVLKSDFSVGFEF